MAPYDAGASHQHKAKQCKGDALHYSDKNFAIHSFTSLGHATHHTERASDGGELYITINVYRLTRIMSTFIRTLLLIGGALALIG